MGLDAAAGMVTGSEMKDLSMNMSEWQHANLHSIVSLNVTRKRVELTDL
jgi:hypothetical protein